MDILTAKIIAMVLMGTLALFFGLIPMKVKQIISKKEGSQRQKRKRERILSSLLCFGAGVLIATVFIHLIPETREGLNKVLNGQNDPLVDKLVGHHDHHDHQHPPEASETGNREKSVISDQNRGSGNVIGSSDSHDHDHANNHEHDHPHDHAHNHEDDHAHNHNDHDHDNAHDHAHNHEHDHEHTHEHAHNHEHDNEHAHDHAHNHDHNNERAHDHAHNHDHINERAYDPDHNHKHDNEHAHDHAHNHEHEHTRDHAHNHDHNNERAHDPDHNHEHDKEHAHDHAHNHEHDHEHAHDDAHAQDIPHKNIDDHSHHINHGSHKVAEPKEEDHASTDPVDITVDSEKNPTPDSLSPLLEKTHVLDIDNNKPDEVTMSVNDEMVPTVTESLMNTMDSVTPVDDENVSSKTIETTELDAESQDNTTEKNVAEPNKRSDDVKEIMTTPVTNIIHIQRRSATTEILPEPNAMVDESSGPWFEENKVSGDTESDSVGANDKLEDSHSHSEGEIHFPFAELLVCLGFFAIYFIEEIMHKIFFHGHDQENEKECVEGDAEMFAPHSHHLPITGMSNQAKPTNKGQPVLTGMTARSEWVKEGIDNPVFAGDIEATTWNPQIKNNLMAQNILNANGTTTDRKPKGLDVPDGMSSSVELAKPKSQKLTSFRSLFIVLALSFHSLFEGMAIGLQQIQSDVWYLFLAISAHKFLIVFCIGLELVTVGIPVMLFIMYILIFALITPIGIGIGILITEYNDVGGAQHTLIVSILQGLAGGTILYVAFIEVLERERRKSGGKLMKLLFLVMGFVLMAALESFGNHKHS